MSNILIIKHGSLGDIAQASGAIQESPKKKTRFTNEEDLKKRIIKAAYTEVIEAVEPSTPAEAASSSSPNQVKIFRKRF